MINTTVSHYRILEKIGQGGMGVVYKAEDAKLKRGVALKFLPPEALGDPELRARFLQEAQAAAALNHPNVCTIYEIDEERGFLAMEFLEGETARALSRKRPLPISEALDIAMQTAKGLEAAHERGVVHRDIKSANLMVTPQGAVKIMDFGLALLSDRTRLTRSGGAVGTPSNMSPEQAQGKTVDRRSDLWSLGVVLYEMVAGQMPFRGESEAAVMYSILHDDPEPVTALRAGLPMELDRIIGKALAKDAGARYQHAEDFLVDLRTLRGNLQLESRAERLAAVAKRRRGLLAPALAGLVLGVAGVSAWVWNQALSKAPPPVVRFSFDLPPTDPIRPTWNSTLAFSPDGKTLAYSHQAGTGYATFLRKLDELEEKPFSSALHLHPVFSPDGQYMLLLNPPGMRLHKAALTGGAPVHFAEWDFAFQGDWAADGYNYWTTHYFGPIVRTPGSGGKEEAVTELDLNRQERTHRSPQMLPGGKAIVFTVSSGGMESFNDARIDAFILGSKQRKTLVQGGFRPRYSPSGHLVYARAGSLYAVPFDVGRVEVTGPPFKVADGVFMSTNTGAAHFAVSSTGSLAYAAGKAEGGERSLVWVDRDGHATPLPLPARSYVFPRISPDGNQIAFEVEGVNHDLYIYDPARGVTSKMTTDGVSHAPVWTPDGKRLGFRSWKAGTMSMWWMPADRSGPEERLTEIGARQSLVSFSPDGRYATFNQMDIGSTMTSGVWILPISGDRKPQAFIQSKFRDGSGRFSPDGKWVVYCSDESGKAEVYVQPWPGPGPKIQISPEGGTDPIWSRDGKELFYRNGDKMMAVAVAVASTFKASMPKMLWQGHYSHGMGSSCGMVGPTSANYDVSADGRRFLMVKDEDQDAVSTRIVVVLNFAEELKRSAQRRDF